MNNLKCKSSLTIHTTSLDLENFISETIGHPYDLISHLESDGSIACEIFLGGIGNLILDINHPKPFVENQINGWNDFKEIGEAPTVNGLSDFDLVHVLSGFVMEGKLSPATYIIERVNHNKNKVSLLSSDSKGMLHDACIEVCNQVYHNKHDDLHNNMTNAVWDAANKVLGAHIKNRSNRP